MLTEIEKAREEFARKKREEAIRRGEEIMARLDPSFVPMYRRPDGGFGICPGLSSEEEESEQ